MRFVCSRLSRIGFFTFLVGLVGVALFGSCQSANAASINGTVYEDVNFGGGAGRSLAVSSGIGIANARVELYDSSGAFLSATTTAANGSYSLSAAINFMYTVRVVNASVGSSRAGGTTAGIMPVQTYRTTAPTGVAAPVIDHVGGEAPNKVDAPANMTSASLSSLTTALATPQSIASALLLISSVNGVDFGFNFDTIVNANDSATKGNAAQGTLGQFVTNANALGNSGITQVGEPAGQETTIFMISDGNAHAGLRAGLADQLSAGVAVISLAANFPLITRSNVAIDGGTQTTTIGDTNPGALGTGGTAGVDALGLSQVLAPEIELAGNNTYRALQVQPSATGFILRKVALYALATQLASFYATGTLIEQNIIGTHATGFTPGLAAADGAALLGSSSGTIRNNLIGFTATNALSIATTATWSVTNNEIRSSSAIPANVSACIRFNAIGTSGSISIVGNLIATCSAQAISRATGGTLATIVNNTISNCGLGAAGGSTPPLGGAIELDGTGTQVAKNIIANNYGAAILVAQTGTTLAFSQNSIFNNGSATSASGGAASKEIGIDLLSTAAPVLPYVSPNKSGGTGSGGNSLLNFPVFDTAYISGTNLVVAGVARPGSTIELFIADAAPTNAFGQGKTYLTTLVEGSGADADATIGSYSNPGGNTLIGTDTSNRFHFTVPLPSGVSVGTALTSTATLSGYGTSEFGPNVSVVNGASVPNVSLALGVTPAGAQAPGTDLTYTTAFTNSSAQAYALAAATPVPANTDFKTGSVVLNLSNTNLTATIQYSNDGGTTWAYTPLSGGGGAPPGYDRTVTNLRLAFSGSLGPTSPYNNGTFSFTARIR